MDDSVGRVLDYLQSEGLLDSTLVIYMGDNGFAFGEHGLIDKRTAYEESMRVPMVMQCPELFARRTNGRRGGGEPRHRAHRAGGRRPRDRPPRCRARACCRWRRGRPVPWRKELLYEYYWERNFPQTPTVFALRGERYKFIRYHGVWDIDELFDLQADPLEMHNLSDDPALARPSPGR